MSSLQALLTQEKERKTGVVFQNMKDIMSGERAYKIQIEGEKKCGKTRFCLSILNYLYFEKGLSPEEILFVWIDLDNGLVPLIEQKSIPNELTGCIDYQLCTDFGEVIEATEVGIAKLKEHIKKHGSAGAWIVIDNMGKAWEGARDFYSRSVYDKSMIDLIMERKVQAIERSAAKTGKKSGTIPAQEFDRMTDYGIINEVHNSWADNIKNSNINFIWTAHLKYEETEVKGNNKTIISRGEGQKHNSARVDFIIRKKLDENRYLTDLLGSRYTSNLFTNVEDMDFTDFVSIVDKTMDIELEKRDKEWHDETKEREKKFQTEKTPTKHIEELKKVESEVVSKDKKLPTLEEVLHAEKDENGEISTEDDTWKF